MGIERVRYLDGKALILDVNYFLKEFVPGLTPEIAANSIYEYIENTLGMQIITSKRRITVEHATARDEKLLDMGTYGCVAVVVNQTFNAAGLLFEYTQSRHQPDYFCFQDIATRKSERQTPGAGVSTRDFALGREPANCYKWKKRLPHEGKVPHAAALLCFPQTHCSHCFQNIV